MLIFDVLTLIAGLATVAYGSETVINLSLRIGARFGISALIMGLFVLSVGTSLPEATTSVVASLMGEGNIVAGDVIGSNLIQITFVLGLIAFIHPIKAKRKTILLIGGSAIIASITAIMVTEKGFVTREDAFFLFIVFGFLLYINQRFSRKEFIPTVGKKETTVATFVIFIIALIGVVIGARIAVTGAVSISHAFGVPEYIIAFLVIGPGGSLPELAVSLSALRKKKFKLAVGNLLGSNIADSTFALGIGPLLAPITVNSYLVKFTGRYMILASVTVITIFAIKEKIDRKTAILFMLIYLAFVIFGLTSGLFFSTG